MTNNIRFRLAAMFGAIALLAPLEVAAQPRGQSRDEARLAAVIADYERYDRAADPITAGFEGDRAALARLPDVSPEALASQRAQLAEMQAALGRINDRRLSPDGALNKAFLARLIGETIESLDFDEARIVFSNDDGFFTTMDYVARTTPIRSREDAEAWLARLSALPLYYDQNIANAERAVSTRFTQPRIVVDRALAVSRAQAEAAPETSSLLLPFAQLPEAIPAAEQASYRARALALVRDQIKPKERAWLTFLETRYLPAARPNLGIRSLPGGEDYYRFLVRQHTTTQLTPDDIHALGRSEVARIRAAMEGVIREAGFTGSFAEFQAFLRSDPQFYAQTPQDLMEKASEIAKRADDRLPSLFATLPRLSYGVRPVPPEIAEGYTTGRYWQGSPVLGQAGAYMVNTSHLDQRPLYELPALTLHEAAPGHHIQIARAQELGELPYFRRTTYLTAFGEGWGLYSEFLGEEMGIYRTPYEKFGRYSYEMWRACRLVADTGIHWLGWDIEEARRCFSENSALAPHNIQTELERYISWPGQALGYKIGELRLRGLRSEAETALGEQFDVRAFHDLVLGAGALPLDVLETRVRAWIADQRNP